MNSRTGMLARVRGSAVGSLTGGVTIAAHGIGGGAVPDEGAIVLLLSVCAALGASVGAVRSGRRQLLLTVTALAAGQAVGHTTLALAADHAHGGVIPASPMLAAHVAALLVTVAVVSAVDTACLRTLAALARVVLVAIIPQPVATRLWIATPVYVSRLSRWSLVGGTAGTRGPPLFA